METPIRIDPNYANAYQKRALAYGGKLDHDQAIADSSEAIRLDPKNVEAYFSRGVAYKYKKEYDKAVSDFTQAIALKPSHVLHQLRAQAYRALGEEAKAISDERKAQAMNK